VLDAIARRMIVPMPGFVSVDDARVAFSCDRILSLTDVTSQMELRQLLNLFESALANFILGARVKPFSQLEPEAQDDVLHEWMTVEAGHSPHGLHGPAQPRHGRVLRQPHHLAGGRLPGAT